MTERALTLLSIIGLASQFVASALLAVLYALLGREVRRRGYFQQWGRAWNALAIALGVLVVRYEVLPLLGVHLTHNWILSNSVGAVYQLGKLLWCLFLVVGTAQFVNGTRRPQATRSGILIALAYAVVSAVAAGSAAQILIWQSPIAMTALAYCAWLMLRLPRSRRSLGSRFAGWAFAIAGDRPFKVGDFVRADGAEGTVEAIGLRSTRLRTLDRTVVTIPNGKLADARIETFGPRDRIRLQCTLQLRLGTRAAQLREVLAGVERALRAQPRIFRDDVRVRLVGLGAWSLDVEVMAWFETGDWQEFLELRQELLLAFLEVVERAGTGLAFPTRTVELVGERKG